MQTDRSRLADAFAVLTEQFELITPDRRELGRACRLIGARASALTPRGLRRITRSLIDIMVAADPMDSAPVAELVAALMPRLPRPLALLAPIIGAADQGLAARGIDLALLLVAGGALPCDRRLLRMIADRHLQEDTPLDDDDLAARLRRAIARGDRPRAVPGCGLAHLLTDDPDPALHCLAARLLDLDGRLPRPQLARRVLGAEAWRVLGPYLAFSRATHRDLVALGGGGRVPAHVVADFRRATSRHGEDLVRRIVAELGWPRLNRGLRIDELVPLRWPGTAPLFVRPEEVALFATEPAPDRGRVRRLVVAQGGHPATSPGRARSGNPVDRFRRLNLVHAELLGEILETAPVDGPKIERILRLMDTAVSGFVSLFADRFPGTTILSDVWEKLQAQARAGLDAHRDGGRLPPDLVRLVLAFEDPANLGEVRTIHGLKRYLHQQGLKLGFSLVDAGGTPNRTVDLLLIPDRGPALAGPTVRFAELEPAAETDPDPWLPHPVRLAIDGFAWQLMYGTTVFPGLDVFIFGNEVQYYVSFRNHPAFLRVDFSPPQRGGMLDLEYYGVSNYETDVHPNLGLDAICAFYRAMGLEVRPEGTRLFVRYDKERSHDLADLQDHATELLRFTPFLMDVDWIMGGLQLSPPLKETVTAAWAERWARSGIFPIPAILTADRRRILVERRRGPAGTEERTWGGEGAYADCWSGEAPSGLWESYLAQIDRLALPRPRIEPRDLGGPLPLLKIHRHLLEPVRRHLEAGRLRVVAGRLERADSGFCEPEHETEYFARLLSASGPAADRALVSAVTMAPVLAFLEKFTAMRTTGLVGALEIMRGHIVLRGGELRIFAARDEHGVTRLGAYTDQVGLLRRRRGPRAPWCNNARTDPGALWTLLRGANYVGDVTAGVEPDPRAAAAELREAARRPGPGTGVDLVSDPAVLAGVAAAPGRATGRAMFGTAGRRTEDCAGCILVAREIRPADGGFLVQAEGILSTGGAVLSHAALLAIQFGKPALVVDAEWDERGPVPALVYRTTLYDVRPGRVRGLRIWRRTVTAHTSGRLLEGDLCQLDAGRRHVRVLGQEPDTLVLWQGLRQLGRERPGTSGDEDPHRILETRARNLRARHQITRALGRLTEATVAEFAVEEIVLGEGTARLPVAERTDFLKELLANPAVAGDIIRRMDELVRNLAASCRLAADHYRNLTPTASCLLEILARRTRYLRRRDTLAMVNRLCAGCGLPPAADNEPGEDPGDGPALARIRELDRRLRRRLVSVGSGDDPLVRHLVRRLERIGRALPPRRGPDWVLTAAIERLAGSDRRTLEDLGSKWILEPAACGLETHTLLGWKGSNLAEMDRLLGPGTVPPWFGVSNTALDTMLEGHLTNSPTARRALGPGPLTLGAAIDGVLRLERLDGPARAGLIRQLWLEAELPDGLAEEVATGHRRLTGGAGATGFMALRSSSCDEDSEFSMQAGVYDTFLYVRGREAVLEHLRLTWAGLWSERALCQRQRAGDLLRRPAGGVVVQRMVEARAAGVLQTVNVAGENLRELVISVGLGLGEGIVSGLVAADLVTVVKDQGPDLVPVHFQYLTNDKPRRMVLDTRRGRGTRLAETLYHQRLRPALEYTELCEIVRKALTLEEAYGYPLDMEFALEGDRLWLLQARPITAMLAGFREALESHPLAAGPRPRTKTGD